MRAPAKLGLVVLILTLAATAAAAQSPTIDFPPTPQATILGGRAIFTVIASGEPPLTYQWRKDGGDLSDGPGVAGATSDALILTDVGFDDAGDYSVVVGNSFGSVTSDEVSLTVNVPQGGDLDSSFDPGSSINGYLTAVAVQPDGKVLIGGAFRTANGALRVGIARVNVDGTIDHTFGNGLAGPNYDVEAIAVQPWDGRILIGGRFTEVNGVSRGRIARLNQDGSLDPTFLGGLPGVDGPIWYTAVFAIAVQPGNGQILIGGEFDKVNGVTRNYIARLNMDGSLDTTFLNGLAGANGQVSAVLVDPAGRVLIGGFFTSVNGTSRGRIARLNSSGSLDASFASGAGANGSVRSLAMQPDGRVLIGGGFTTVHAVSRNGIARLNAANGSLDTSFLEGFAGANSTVGSITLQFDGRVLIGGGFTTVNGVSRIRIARLESDGGLDTSFLEGLAGPNDWVASVVLQPDGRVLIGGSFSSVNGVGRNRLARLNADGGLDTTLQSDGWKGVSGEVDALVVQPDGRVLIGGRFTTVNGASRNRIARLNADGSLDATFLDGLDGTDGDVRCLALQPDGRILVGGGFGAVNGVGRGRIARLNADGSLDTSFLDDLAGASNWVFSVALQPDGRVLIGGSFTTVNGLSRNRIARLSSDGSLDTTFVSVPGPNDAVSSIALQPDGRVLIAGWFGAIDDVGRDRIARLNADGELDPTFLPDTGEISPVMSIALQPDGRVLVGGIVWGPTGESVVRLNHNGTSDPTFEARLEDDYIYYPTVESVAVQPDGRVLIGGRFNAVNDVDRHHIARLNADGSLDTMFLDGRAGATKDVKVVAAQPDGLIMVAGTFAGVNGAASPFVARLYRDPPVVPVITKQPESQASYDGCCAVFRVEASGTPLDYRWRKDGVALTNGSNVDGVTGPTLTVTGVSTADTGAYSVVVSNVLRSVTSTDALLSVSSVPPCRLGTCDPVWGCVLSEAPDGTACDDANACTGIDTCLAGACNSADCVCIVAPDADGDGYGDASSAAATCDPTVPPGQVANAGDCDDASAAIRPGAPEICDALRNDCSVGDWPALLDADRDVVEDACDNCAASSNPDQADADRDEYGNSCDDCKTVANDQANSDADVRGDACDNCVFEDNSAQTDSDADGVGDACEVDADDDGIPEDDGDATDDPCTGGVTVGCDDNCPVHINALQEDGDGDGSGDPCDNCAGDPNSSQTDTDRDDVGDACDGCTDSDGDGAGDPGFPLDACPADGCPHDAQNDADADGVCADADNCPDAHNPSQEDLDGDRVGDACDNCLADHNPGQDNADGLTESPGPYLGNVCDLDMDGDGTQNEADADQDGDGVPEDDGDGIPDSCPSRVRSDCDDNCPMAQNTPQLDLDSDGVGDACDFDDGVVGVYAGTVLSWQPEEGAVSYNVYRGQVSALSPVEYGTCYRSGLEGTQASIVEDPPAGEVYTYLVTVVTSSGEGSLGEDSDNVQRVNAQPCW